MRSFQTRILLLIARMLIAVLRMHKYRDVIGLDKYEAELQELEDEID